ncbi:MAG TPA: AAA family ATPase [Solirubrobacteraceae bacterium]|nr:AAA family ATPase [Solirubrobacteraceae bacterium]
MTLLEREGEIAELRVTVAAMSGRVVLIEGPAGAGKSALLAEAASLGEHRAFDARGGELERGLPFGVVRQLFAQVDLAALDGPAELARPALDPRSARAAEPAAVLHGLYWLCAELAEREPLMLAVDDVHWADNPSLRFLAYLGRRIADLPAVVVAALRTDEPQTTAAPLEEVRASAVAVLRPQPLSVRAARLMLGEVDEATARAAHDTTGGNPFLLSEVRRALAQGTPLEEPPAAVAERTAARLRRVGQRAVRVAEAVAVLGAEAELRDAAAVAGLSYDEALGAVDTLTAAGLIAGTAPLRFLHPLVRTAVYEALPAGRRAQLHRVAARTLDDRAAAALHLLATPPSNDPRAADVLAQAAADALAAGAPAEAAELARRALAERPAPERRFAVLATLARSATRLGVASGPGLAHEAVALAPDLPSRVAIVRELALLLVHTGQVAAACEVLEQELDRLGAREREARLLLEGDLASIAQFDPARIEASAARVEKLADGLRGSTPGERAVLCTSSLLQPNAATAAAVALRARAISDIHDSIPGAGLWAPGLAMLALAYAERIDDAAEWIAAFLEWDVRNGSLTGLAADHALMAVCHWLAGRVHDQEAEAKLAIEAALQGSSAMLPFASALAALALAERGVLEEAAAHVDNPLFDAIPPEDPAWIWLGAARGYVRLAGGRPREATSGLDAAVHHPARGIWRWTPLLFGPWLARARAAAGDTAGARAAVAEASACARRWDSPRYRGMALALDGALLAGDEGIARLRQGVRVLESSVARLEHARALVDLGAALRRANRRSEARASLREGMDLAVRCGSDLLVGRAHDELSATGARPRRLVLTGVDSLTPTERRVAVMAARRMSNREIAQALFVSHRTVEMHLSRAYRKLGIAGRDELAVALARR